MCEKWVCSILPVVMGLLVVTQPADAQQVENLVLNHSFEEDEVIQDDGAYDGWWTWNPAEGAGSVASVDNTDSIDGSRSIRVDPFLHTRQSLLPAHLPIELHHVLCGESEPNMSHLLLFQKDTCSVADQG